jgi:hypothetical protein
MTATGRETEWQRRIRRDRERAWLKGARGNRCEVCGVAPKSRELHVDHDHHTGLSRGLLCHKHNRVMWIGATPRELRAMADYLERTTPP